MKFKDIVNKFISVYFTLIGFVASKTSSRCRVWIGSVLGDFMRLVGRRRMKITLDNLSHAFPEKSEAEIERIELEIAKIDGILANPGEHSGKLTDGSIYIEYEALKQQLAAEMNVWEQLHQELDILEKSVPE